VGPGSVNRAPLEKTAIVLTPLVAVATVALGLRVGASSRVLGAKVYAAAPGGGRSGVALEIVTWTEEGDAPEVISEPGLTVIAFTHGQEARWTGSSNKDGVAEAWLDLPARPNEWIDAKVTNASGVVLASGRVALPSAGATGSNEGAAVHPMRRTGPLALDAFVYGRLIPGATVPVLVRVRRVGDAGGLASLDLKAEPEPGLTVGAPTCASDATSNDTWCTVPATAEFLTASWRLAARVPAGPGVPPQEGTWYGSLPVSPGGATSDLPERLDSGAPRSVHFVVPPATRRLYVEVVDAAGVDMAAALDVAPATRGGEAETVLPGLGPGAYWLVTSPDLRGLETGAGATIARPFRVVSRETESAPGAVLRDLVTRMPPTIARPLALDGLLAPRRRAAAARRRGMLLAFGALLVAAVCETLLILQTLRRGRIRLDALSEATFEATGEAAPLVRDGERSRSLLAVAAVLFITLLGFALLAGLLAMSGTA